MRKPWPSADEIRVEIRSEEGDPQLAAAIELVSPANKDRPRSARGIRRQVCRIPQPRLRAGDRRRGYDAAI